MWRCGPGRPSAALSQWAAFAPRWLGTRNFFRAKSPVPIKTIQGFVSCGDWRRRSYGERRERLMTAFVLNSLNTDTKSVFNFLAMTEHSSESELSLSEKNGSRKNRQKDKRVVSRSKQCLEYGERNCWMEVRAGWQAETVDAVSSAGAFRKSLLVSCPRHTLICAQNRPVGTEGGANWTISRRRDSWSCVFPRHARPRPRGPFKQKMVSRTTVPTPHLLSPLSSGAAAIHGTHGRPLLAEDTIGFERVCRDMPARLQIESVTFRCGGRAPAGCCGLGNVATTSKCHPIVSLCVVETLTCK